MKGKGIVKTRWQVGGFEGWNVEAKGGYESRPARDLPIAMVTVGMVESRIHDTRYNLLTTIIV